MPDVTETDDFARRFGQLVERYVISLGWTHEQVAHAVWGDSARKSHVTAYIKGTKGKPSNPTIAKFVKALGITEADLEACRLPPEPVLSATGAEALAALKLEDAVFFQLAARFGHDNPWAGSAAYKTFLEQKAEEYRALEVRLASLTDMEEAAAARARLDNQLKAAQAAIADGAFEEADEILAAAEEVQQAEHTLREVRRQAALRTTRGEAALLNGDADAAHTHFAKAAAMFDPFDILEAAKARNTAQNKLWKHAQRYGPGFALAASLLRRNIATLSEKDHPDDWGGAQNNLGTVLGDQGARTGGEAGAALLGEAVAAYRAALRVRTEDTYPVDWAMTQNNLGIALRNQGARTGEEAGSALLGEAVAAYRAALRVRTENAHPVQWAETTHNIGAVFESMAELEPEALRAHLEAAIREFEAALCVFDPEHMPYYHRTVTEARDRVLGKLAGLG
ncbi:MAG: helix-turn-helix transcriptional regulator [Pseudomonadota bacterium]